MSIQVIVHPLVLLSVVDHYNRVIGPPSSLSSKKRVVGVLLGYTSTHHGSPTLHVSNSYAVPFEEDDKNPNVWFLDHNYHEKMVALFRKVNAKEQVVGWYHTGGFSQNSEYSKPKCKASDLSIHRLFQRYTPNPILVLVDVHSSDTLDSKIEFNQQPEWSRGIPVESFILGKHLSSEELTFSPISCTIQGEEAEEVGVEHLLRDIRGHSFASSSVFKSSDDLFERVLPVSTELFTFQQGLKSLYDSCAHIQSYLIKVQKGELPLNQDILNSCQNMMNQLPDSFHDQEWKEAWLLENNDHTAMIYISSLLRSILVMHDLVDNKLINMAEEKKLDLQ